MVALRHVLISCAVMLHLALCVPPPAVGVDPRECRSLMDLFLVIDGSDSILPQDFVTLQRAIASFVPQIDLGENKARIGMLVYSSTVPMASLHSFSSTKSQIIDWAISLQHPQDGTNTALGIEKMIEMFDMDGRRNNVPWMGVVITDGNSKRPTETQMQAKRAAKKGINMFAVGVGHSISTTELVNIASTPNQAFPIDNFQQLADKLVNMMAVICPCPVPPSITNSRCSAGARAIGTVREYTCLDGYLQRGNGVMKCQNDFTWTPIDPTFECVACSMTPPIVRYGVCGTGEILIGSHRSFTCEPGYMPDGDPKIVCLADATWSIPNFRCVPCGDPPVIPNANCGEGSNLLGSQRFYKCLPGYLPDGNPMIECNQLAKWTVLNFRCLACGITPDIPNGVCGGGDHIIGAMRMYTCDEGYKPVGNPQIRCTQDAMWTAPELQCVACGATPDILNGVCGGGDHIIGAMRMYTCDEGYKPVGNPQIRCTQDATWTAPELQCVACGATPDILNGVCGGGAHIIGAMRMYTCNEGYKPVGNPQIRCTQDATWTAPELQCVACGVTPDILNGVCGGGDHIIGAMRMYTCDKGYKPVGNPQIRCTQDATWTAPELQCVACGVTPDIPNGKCGGGDHIIGAMRMYTCDEGYKPVGNAQIRCTQDATWTAPELQCVACGVTPDILNGVCGGGDHIIGAMRMYTCDEGYKPVGNPQIRCTQDATWTAPELQCVACGATPVILNGVCGGGDHIIGAMRMYTCNEGYKPVGNPQIRCTQDATWTAAELQCVACGVTPDILNGVCGGGDHIIGAMRMYTCDKGYKPVGNPQIRCTQDATWTVPELQCVACGATPDILNGVCGGGDHIIGAMRMYTCDKGYKPVGNPQIRCTQDATWTAPELQCVACGVTPDILNGVCGGGDHIIGAMRMYTCDEGYKPVGNPQIRCTQDATWTVPELRCVACTDTPVMPLSSCQGSEHKIGTIRHYVCDTGYFMFGNPQIKCNDDAMWSQPEFECIPCSDTPVVMNAKCGSGGHLIGNTRIYSCLEGYILQGNPKIECMPNAKWSVPTLKCIDCGAPPKIPYAYTSLGSTAIGSTVEYHCETGYDLYGRGEVSCNANGMWTETNFRCELKPTTTTTTPSPVPSDPSVCDACRYINGVGYNNHPYDCSQYVQCFLGRRGIEPVYRRCPFGLFWDQNVLTCRPADQVVCPFDMCKMSGVLGYRHSDFSRCCSYMKCEGGRAFGRCCGKGYSFDTASQQCVYNPGCEDDCPFDDEVPVCDLRPAASEVMYEQHIGNGFWVPMHCAPGTAFNPVDCRCSLQLIEVPDSPRKQVCKPEVYLPFTTGFDDRSGKNVPVYPENVTIINGEAYFNGRSRILINRYSNVEFRGDLVIKFRYKEVREGAEFQQLQALVTNGDCGDDPSIVIAKMPQFVLLGCKTDVPKSFALPTLDKEWKEVIYLHDERKLEGHVCGASMNKWSYGPIQATHCAMQIGYGHGLTSYHGYIDDFTVYQCRPRQDILTINY
ncbi:sushi, von Willebrand factor type A, EGF and pentraxin domain-containing protein 1-like [Mya arenaria]|nr:sushi, von Willebrand factor type A, EGF and pentraxin domain-containing protein 1-like [Mya arenaria]XP_052801432.1 sushi, von Willebrand factor type A, EGF and pentraxin domain-containing protein 1-like [Mya arenaria]